ncbi:hypothetical protein K7B10_21145 [Streptomyces flavotricini]|uniref:Uncharacterized protein n=1 Tax=Streptomyces flavotricini TaxID=66888 RepID=A0ABS8E975_9ACTN|nr:hypothetical protein [Streptomyces flavotricini]MCC0097254.1 hypothetical protein [Streptomyces flavotricini]
MRRAADGGRSFDGVALAAFAKALAGEPRPQPPAGNGTATSVRNSFVWIVTARVKSTEVYVAVP